MASVTPERPGVVSLAIVGGVAIGAAGLMLKSEIGRRGVTSLLRSDDRSEMLLRSGAVGLLAAVAAGMLIR